jgi:hypothetical protein
MMSAGLPEGWRIEYAKALSEAKASRYLKGSAEKFWSQHGGWTAHKSAPHGAIAQAIFDAFETIFRIRKCGTQRNAEHRIDHVLNRIEDIWHKIKGAVDKLPSTRKPKRGGAARR